ncbi:MAG: nuclear transport factor 2 family protein [Planctomycetota bacterium]
MARHRAISWANVVLLLGLGVGLYVLARQITVTDEERIEDLVEGAAQAVREGDFEAFAASLATDYSGRGRTRDGAVAEVERLLRLWHPVGLEADVGEVTVDGDAARAPVRVTARIVGRPFTLPLAVTFARTDEGWRIAGARLGR